MRILIHHESSGYTCRTTPEEDKLIVVVPLVLNLHLELDRKMSIVLILYLRRGSALLMAILCSFFEDQQIKIRKDILQDF